MRILPDIHTRVCVVIVIQLMQVICCFKYYCQIHIRSTLHTVFYNVVWFFILFSKWFYMRLFNMAEMYQANERQQTKKKERYYCTAFDHICNTESQYWLWYWTWWSLYTGNKCTRYLRLSSSVHLLDLALSSSLSLCLALFPLTVYNFWSPLCANATSRFTTNAVFAFLLLLYLSSLASHCAQKLLHNHSFGYYDCSFNFMFSDRTCFCSYF